MQRSSNGLTVSEYRLSTAFISHSYTSDTNEAGVAYIIYY